MTGIGLVSSLGRGQTDTWTALTEGRSGIREIARFPNEGLRTRIAARSISSTPTRWWRRSCRSGSPPWPTEEALEQANLGGKGDFPGPLFIAVPPVEMEWPQRQALAEAAGSNEAVDYAGLLRAVATGRFDAWHDLFLFGTVADRIAERFAPAAPRSRSRPPAPRRDGDPARRRGDPPRRERPPPPCASATDGSVNPESLIRFSLPLGPLDAQRPAREASRPFSKDGTGSWMGEGAAALVLEDAAAAVARGATILGYVLGCGEKGDGFHRTRSSPDGAPIIAAIRASLDDAGLPPEAIDTVNATAPRHPRTTGWRPWASPPCRRAGASLPVNSNKSMIGHTLTAAGAIEAAASLLSIRHGPDPADDQLPHAGPGARPRHRGRGPRHAGADRALQLLRFRRAEYLPRSRGGAGMSAVGEKRVSSRGRERARRGHRPQPGRAGYAVDFTYRSRERRRPPWPTS